MLLVSRWILARLRDRRFFSLTEVNAAIAPLLEILNDKPFQKLEGSRRSWFELLGRSRDPGAARNRLRVRAVQAREGLAHRLPRRFRAPLLLGAARAWWVRGSTCG